MFRLIKRSKIIKLSLLKIKNGKLFECIYEQLKYALITNWKWKLETFNIKNVFVNYIDNEKDLIYFKEEYELNTHLLDFKNKDDYIDAKNPLLIGFCILHDKLEYYDFKYCIKYRYIELIEVFLQGLGLGTRLLNRIKSNTKKTILPLVIIKNADTYWYKNLSKFINLNTLTTLKKYIDENGLTREIKWDLLKDVIVKKQRKVIKSYSTKFVKNIIDGFIKKIELKN